MSVHRVRNNWYVSFKGPDGCRRRFACGDMAKRAGGKKFAKGIEAVLCRLTLCKQLGALPNVDDVRAVACWPKKQRRKLEQLGLSDFGFPDFNEASAETMAEALKRALRSSTPKKHRRGLSPKTRFAIFERDGFACQYCGRTAPTVVLAVDHVVPVAEGGSDAPTNLTTACKECNAGKGAKVLTSQPGLGTINPATHTPGQ